jgi:Lrp/AsnC family leucine-responsive transcriptional regulator
MGQKKRSLDATDLNILAKLQKNARASFTEIGLVVGLSAPAVRDRIRQMESHGVISGYRVIVNQTLLGNPIRAILAVQVKREYGKWRVPDNAVTDMFRSMPEVLRYWSVTGDVDFIIEVAMPSMKRMEEFHRRLNTLGIFTTYIILEDSNDSAEPSGAFGRGSTPRAPG